MRKWKPFNVGPYRLGILDGEAVAVWYDGEPRRRHRWRLAVTTEADGNGGFLPIHSVEQLQRTM